MWLFKFILGLNWAIDDLYWQFCDMPMKYESASFGIDIPIKQLKYKLSHIRNVDKTRSKLSIFCKLRVNSAELTLSVAYDSQF